MFQTSVKSSDASCTFVLCLTRLPQAPRAARALLQHRAAREQDPRRRAKTRIRPRALPLSWGLTQRSQAARMRKRWWVHPRFYLRVVPACRFIPWSFEVSASGSNVLDFAAKLITLSDAVKAWGQTLIISCVLISHFSRVVGEQNSWLMTRIFWICASSTVSIVTAITGPCCDVKETRYVNLRRNSAVQAFIKKKMETDWELVLLETSFCYPAVEQIACKHHQALRSCCGFLCAIHSLHTYIARLFWATF